MINHRAIFLLLGALLLLPAFTRQESTFTLPASGSFQPPDERKAQEKLPQSKDATWGLLAKTKILVDEKRGLYKAVFPDEVQKLNHQTLTISGFMVPLESSVKSKHYLLSKRTPTCPFCQPGAPNEIVEIYLAKPMDWDEGLISFEGNFELSDNEESGIFFVMKDAVKK